jgi:hypothetical protein
MDFSLDNQQTGDGDSHVGLVELLATGTGSPSTTDQAAALFPWLADAAGVSGPTGQATRELDMLDVFGLMEDELAPHVTEVETVVATGDLESVDGTAVEHVGALIPGKEARGSNTSDARKRSVLAAMLGHHCEAEMISALRALDGLPRLDLGAVLDTSRSALDRALKVVTCTCTPNTNVALLITAVLVRIFCWHDMVLQSDSGPASRAGLSSTAVFTAESERPEKAPRNRQQYDEVFHAQPHGRPSTPRDGNVRPQASAGLIVPPITIGLYELDEENRASMIAHIVLSQLGKANQLLDTFSQKFRRHSSSAVMGHNDSRSQLHVAMEMFLRNQHAITVLSARAKLELK